MSRRRKHGKPPEPAASATTEATQVHDRVGSARLEVLMQAEALLARAMTYVTRVGSGDDRCWPGRVARPDRFQVRIASEAVSLAVDRIGVIHCALSTEIAAELGLAPASCRKKYRVIERTPRDEPEPPLWFLPPEHDEPAPPGDHESMYRPQAVNHDPANDDPSR